MNSLFVSGVIVKTHVGWLDKTCEALATRYAFGRMRSLRSISLKERFAEAADREGSRCIDSGGPFSGIAVALAAR